MSHRTTCFGRLAEKLPKVRNVRSNVIPGVQRKFCGLAVLSVLLAFSSSARPQHAAADANRRSATPPVAQEQHLHENTPAVAPQFPEMGRAQQRAGSQAVSLEMAEKIAAESNPTLRQAEVEIRAAQAREKQAGLYPNPSVGYMGDEIRGGSVGGGKQGFFVQQTIVTGGKLGKNRAVFASELKLAQTEAEEQKFRVETAVKMAFERVLAAQERLDAIRDLAKIAEDSAQTQRELKNTGQADDSEVLEVEIEAERVRMAARMQENTLREEWRSLATVIGKPEMPEATVAGDLEKGWPDLNEDEAVQAIATKSPALQIADESLSRAQAILSRAQRQPIPDIRLRAGLEYNNELLGTAPWATGWEGQAEASVELPIFNRNQGNIGAARADADRAAQEKTRVALTLRERAATVVDEYINARLMALEYRDEMLPQARKAYSLLLQKYSEMQAAYPRVLAAQRKLFELQLEYIAALEGVWTNGLALQGYLLTDGLEAPARPGEVDRPIRETNVPSPERSMAPGEGFPQP
ncbi:MAG TPA: TolC family protein [Candidatus Acidoferrum sp.]|nr:TolC family protein [Candidatus Acidoferrum sp.]